MRRILPKKTILKAQIVSFRNEVIVFKNEIAICSNKKYASV